MIRYGGRCASAAPKLAQWPSQLLLFAFQKNGAALPPGLRPASPDHGPDGCTQSPFWSLRKLPWPPPAPPFQGDANAGGQQHESKNPTPDSLPIGLKTPSSSTTCGRMAAPEHNYACPPCPVEMPHRHRRESEIILEQHVDQKIIWQMRRRPRADMLMPIVHTPGA